MDDKRAMLAFMLKEPVTITLRDCELQGTIAYVKTKFKTAGTLQRVIDGENKKIIYSYGVIPVGKNTVYEADAGKLSTAEPEPPAEYAETILKGLFRP